MIILIDWYKVRRNGYAIFLYTDLASIEFVKKSIEPYYIINKVISVSEVFDSSYWKISNRPDSFKLTSDKIDIIQSKQRVLDEPERVFFVEAHERIIELIKPVDTKWRDQIVIRLIRDIFRNYFLTNDSMSFFHGGLIKSKNLGIAFMGGKKSGKTSSILSFLKYGNVDYATNDDISIQIIDDKVHGFGWPRTVSVRNDTFDVLEMDRASIIGRLRHPSNGTIWKNKATFIYPNELEQLFTTKVISNSEVNYIVFPTFDKDIYTPNLRELNRSEFKKLLELNMEPDINRYFKDFQRYFPNVDISSNNKVLDIISEKCHGIILNQNFKNLKQSVELVKKELM